MIVIEYLFGLSNDFVELLVDFCLDFLFSVPYQDSITLIF